MSAGSLNRFGYHLGLALVFGLVTTSASYADPTDPRGDVRLPLDAWRELERRLESFAGKPQGIAIAEASVGIDASPENEPPLVTATFTAEVLGESWGELMLLPAGVALESATVDGAPMALLPRVGGLVWVAAGSGRRQVVLRYRIAPVTSGAGARVLEVPLPAAASVTLSATLPGGGEGTTVQVSPGTVTSSVSDEDSTTVTAVIPRSQVVRLSWGPGAGTSIITSATYAGEVGREVVRWKADFGLENVGAEVEMVPVLRSDVAILNATLDGAQAVFEERGERLYVRVSGRGRHTLSVTFEAPTRQGEGPMGTVLWTPRAPISSFVLSLEGDKEVETVPAGGVETTMVAGRTVAKVFLPVSDEVAFNWSAALPETHELRTNAEIIHTVRADEGVLEVTALTTFEVARGKAQSFTVSLPDGVAVNNVVGEGLSDWRVGDPSEGRRVLSIYLDREVSGSFTVRIDYELLVDAKATTPHTVPLVTADNVRRQRGMVALVRGTELEVLPVTATGLTQVGENQLPVQVRDLVSQKVTHTYKYAEPGGALLVKLSPFVRELARFDAVIDTLYSLGEGVLRAAATLEITVKAGSFAGLEVVLPDGINILSASAPSLREHRVVEGKDGKKTLALAFTREMEGAVRVELVWEKVLSQGDNELAVPLVHVTGAVVEHGRLAIEALSAVEVQELQASRMNRVDASELPQKLVLRTTNPILLAYHYVHADPPAALKLSVKRHAEVAVQVAAIDSAHYQTLWTRDGVALTRARYTVRNRGKQFLRVTLPTGATVWSAELAGQAVKPASDESGAVLVPLLNASEAFEVVLVYLVKGEPMGFSGEVEAELLVPDLIETESTWEVFLPDEVTWGEVDTNMSVVSRPDEVLVVAQNAELAKGNTAQTGVAPLQIRVPERGKRLVLQKLLSNQGSERASFRIGYRGDGAGQTGLSLVLVGGFALMFLVLRLTSRATRTPTPLVVGVGVVCCALIAVGLIVFGASLTWLLLPLGLGLLLATFRLIAEKRRRTAEGQA